MQDDYTANIHYHTNDRHGKKLIENSDKKSFSSEVKSWVRQHKYFSIDFISIYNHDFWLGDLDVNKIK